MEPKWHEDGFIVNPEELTADQVVHRRVLCPACRLKVFEMWPEGWDSHADKRCGGIRGKWPQERKAEFKERFRKLFRDSKLTPPRVQSGIQREKAANAPLSGRERLDGYGVIINAEELTLEELKMRRVLCPACKEKVLMVWPSGWDGHASHACTAMKETTPEARRDEYRKRFGYLLPSRNNRVKRNAAGVILNSGELAAADVVHQSVLCPACRKTVFAMWPEGWDVHAARKCTGLQGEDPQERKAEFKERFRKLFRK